VDRAARFTRLRIVAAFLVPFTIPISTSVSEIVTVAAFVLLAVEGEWRRALPSILAKPIVLASVALFLLLGIGTLYSIVPWPAAAHIWFKYRELIYLPLFMLLCRDLPAARAGLLGVYAVVAAIVVLGGAQWLFGISLTPHPFGRGSVFGSYIVEGVLTSVTAYYFAQEAVASRRWRILWSLAAIIAVAYVLCVTPGRTGIVVAFVMAAIFLFQTAPRRWLVPGLLLIALVGGGIYRLSPEFNDRVGGMFTGLQGEGISGAARSTITRMQFYRGALETMASSPVFGTGTGSFEKAYGAVAVTSHLPLTSNPHNEYLMIGVQIGILGVATMLGLLATLWLSAASLPLADAMRGRAVTFALATSCLVNSSMLDHVDSQIFFFQISLFFVGVLGRDDQRHRNDI
jgi:O-antigen ligase